jgi:Tfp pilus assembly protein PilF
MKYVNELLVAPLLRWLGLGVLLALGGCSFSGGSKSTAPAPLQEIPAAVQALFDAAQLAQKNQQWSDAERHYQQLLEKYPQLSGPALNLALIYAQTQRPQLAEESFQRAMQINPDNNAAGDQYGIWLRTQGRFDAAEAMYLQTLARHPDYAAAHLNLAILYDIYLGKPASALEYYQRYLELNNDEQSPVCAWIADLQRRLQRAG